MVTDVLDGIVRGVWCFQCEVGIVQCRVLSPEVPEVIGLIGQAGRVTLVLGTYQFEVLVEVLQGLLVVVLHVRFYPPQGEQGIGTQGVVGIAAHHDVGKVVDGLVEEHHAVLIVIGTYLVGFREEFVCYVLLFDGSAFCR